MFEVQKSSEMKLLGMLDYAVLFSGSCVVCHTG